MVRNLLCLFILAILAGSAGGAWADAATRPTVSIAAFQMHAPQASQWVGDAVTDGLSTGLANSFALSGDHPDFTIDGAVQVVDDQIRIRGQIRNASGKRVATLNYDGALRDLFSIEDVLVNRAERVMTPPKAAVAAAASTPVVALLPGSGETTVPQSRYFDGNLSAVISPAADPWVDQRTHAMLYSQNSYWCYYGSCYYGGCYGCGNFCPVPSWGGRVQYTATPISGW